ncbi:MAG: hypothetical protein ACREIT_09235 [Tepidisphaeraceae bacterium]
MSEPLRDFIYLDYDRTRSLAAQLGIETGATTDDRAARERLFMAVEPALIARGQPLRLDPAFEVTHWTPDAFADGRFVVATGPVRLLNFAWLSSALDALPAVLKKMSKMEMEALRSSDEGRRMSKSQLQQRSQENQLAIAKVEEFKMGELSDAVTRLYAGVVRVKVLPVKDQPRCMLVGSAYVEHFADSPAALSQKYGVEVDAGWTVVGQLNVPNLNAPPQPVPTGNQMEDGFEQIALLMNNAFKLANSPAFPAVSFTPVAIYRTAR